ncbi:hypothetical protein PI124_g11421 [Phytophthora idaei]|nr:hypothetical protein PI124_g11421 [Phytophthora idaei]
MVGSKQYKRNYTKPQGIDRHVKLHDKRSARPSTVLIVLNPAVVDSSVFSFKTKLPDSSSLFEAEKSCGWGDFSRGCGASRLLTLPRQPSHTRCSEKQARNSVVSASQTT